MKKLLALVLALVMTLSLCTVSNAAYSDAADVDYKEAVDVMTAAGVFNGTDGKFNPDGILTREQAAKIVTYMLLGKKAADALVTIAAPFADVAADRWSAGSIAYCYNEGILAGVGAGKFDPAGQLTGLAFAKMMLVALGYNAENEGLTGANWSINVAKLALSVGLTDNLNDVVLSAPMTREQAAQMALNTEEATMVEYDNDTTITAGNVTIKTSSAAKKVARADAKIDYRNGATEAVNGNTLQFCENYASKLTKATTAAADDAKRPATTWSWDGTEIDTYVDSAWKTIVINNSDAATANGVLTSADYFNLKATALDVDHYYVNGEEVLGNETLRSGDVVELYKDAAGKVETVVVLRYQLAKITKVDTAVSKADAKNDVTAYVTLKNLSSTAFGNGTYNDTAIVGFAADAYVKGAYLAVAMDSANKIVDSYVAKTAEGTVSAYKASQIKVNGTTYEIAYTKDAGSASSFAFDNSNYAVYTTNEGYVLGIVGKDAVKLEDVYYVYGTYFETAANGSSTYYALVVDMDGVKSEKVIEKTTYKDTFGNADTTTENTFYPVDALYTFSDKDAVTAGGGATNYGGDVATVDAKSNNDKLSAKAYTSNSTYYVTDSTLNGAVTKSSGALLTAGGTPSKIYVNADTKFVLIDADGTTASMTIDTVSGGARIADTVPVIVISTKSGSSYVAQRVVAVSAAMSTGVIDTAAVAYLVKQPTLQVLNGYEGTLYFMDGTTETVTVDNNDTAGFYNYAVNSKGVYELDAITAMYVAGTTASNLSYTSASKDAGWVAGTVDSIYASSKLTLDTINGNTTYKAYFTDVTLSDKLQVADSRATKTVYTSAIDSLDKLEAAMDRGTVAVEMYVDNGEVLMIGVTGVASNAALLTALTINGQDAVLYPSYEAAAAAQKVTVTKNTALTLVLTKSDSSTAVCQYDQAYTTGAPTLATLTSGTSKTSDADSTLDLIKITITSEDGTSSNVYWTAVVTPAAG